MFTYLPLGHLLILTGPRLLSHTQKQNRWAWWTFINTAYASATTLYAIDSLTGFQCTLSQENGSFSESYIASKVAEAYNLLKQLLQMLFEQRTWRQANPPEHAIGLGKSAGLLHRFVLWPMVIAGVQAALIRADQEVVECICSNLREMAVELGTFSMIHGPQSVES